MAKLDTDYLIVGAGAVGLAFADAMLDQSDAHLTIVDRHGKPGGHWNDAYSFVTLHQPSAFYGVNSTQLGSNRRGTYGVNTGLYELATGHEVSGYFDRVMQERLLPSGRVSYFPMSDYLGDGCVQSLLSGAETAITVRRKTVDATYYGTSVPSTHVAKFKVADGVRVVPPNALPDLWQAKGLRPKRFVILGAGKTAMDVGVWLLNSGAAPDSISWVVPRDSWLLNRRTTQPGMEFFHDVFGAQVAQMKAFAQSRSVDEVFQRLESDGVMLRIDPAVQPTMFHYATISQGEVDVLRRITHVIRKGRVLEIQPDALVLVGGRVEMAAADTLYIDCTASAVTKRPTVPVFQDGKIVLQMIRVPQPAFSAALTAYIECDGTDDAHKNVVCTPVPLPDTLAQFANASLVNMTNQFRWGQDKALRNWIRECRLDGFGKVLAAVAPDDAEKMAVLGELKTYAMAAAANIPRLT